MIARHEPKSLKGEQTAERILEASVRCIAELGVENASITQIASRAKVSRALVAHYFPVKAKLFGQVIAYVSQRAQLFIHGNAEGGEPPRARLRSLCQRNFDFFAKHPYYGRCYLLFYYYCGVDAELRRQNAEMTAQAESRIEKLFSELKVAEPAARARELHDRLLGALTKVVAAKRDPEESAAELWRQVERWLGDR